MISRETPWHPRYGVMPGYGDVALDGLLSVFVATATAGQSGLHFVGLCHRKHSIHFSVHSPAIT
jgi:hypothetical protein